MSEDYDPARYWTQRLSDEYSLRGTGCVSYSPGYNRWLYRHKRGALRRGLRGIRSGGTALDLGSGTGWVVEELRERGLRVDGCDIAPNAVEELRRRFPESRFFHVALGEDQLPGDPGTYDLVTALDVVYHMTDDQAWRSMMAEVGRVLKPGGRFVASDRLGSEDVQAAKHVRFRSLARWQEAARAAGLSIKRVRPYYRWLSRERAESRLARYSDDKRGAIEFALELLAPRKPHMRLVVLEKPRP